MGVFSLENENRKVVGKILSGATTSRAICQLLKEKEGGNIKEGMLVIVRSLSKNGEQRDILARIESIQPIDESYEPGGFLTEAIRKGLHIPTDISRRYELAELELLFTIGSSKEIKYPPLPGDSVLLIDDISRLAECIYGVKDDDNVIEYGTLDGYENLPVLFDIESLPMHLAVFGITGSGKSYNVGALIEKLSELKVRKGGGSIETHLPIIAIDPNGDYIDYWDHYRRNGKLGKFPRVVRYVFTSTLPEANISQKDYNYIRMFNIDLNVFKDSPRSLAEAIVLYHSADISGRELQVSALSALFAYLLEEKVVNDLNALFKTPHLYNTLINYIDNPPDNIHIHSSTAASIKSHLEFFKNDVVNKLVATASEPFNFATVDKLVNDGGMFVIDFTVDGAPGFPLNLKQFIVYYISYVLFKRFIEYKSKGSQKSLLFIIEEAQNYCPDLSEYKIGYSLARDVLQQIATQGRKFGLCLCLVTQRPSFVDPVVISMCNTYLIHRIAPGDETFVKKVTGGLPKSLETKLTKLETGKVIITGQAIKSGLPILASINKDRDRKVEQRAGKVKIIEGLPKKEK